MYSKLIFYKLCFLSGIIVLIVGIIMTFYNFSDSGYTYGSRGGYGKGSIRPNGTLGISILLLLLGVTVRDIYRKEKVARIAEKDIENTKLKNRKGKGSR